MRILEILFESPEARIEYLAKTMGQKLVTAAEKDASMKAKEPAEIAELLADFDPTPNKKALNFIAKLYASGAIRAEDKKKISSTIELFYKVANKLKNKDLMSYKNLNDLYDTLAPFEENDKEALSGRQQKKLVKADAEKLIDTPDFKVIIPKTEEAARYYGANTKWCTAADEDCMFNHYNEKGPLFVIIAGEGAKARKFQLHYESGQFMDERDVELSSKDIAYLSKFPQYKEFLDHLIDKHYGKFIDEK